MDPAICWVMYAGQDELVCVLFLLPLLEPAICSNSPMAHTERSGLGTRMLTHARSINLRSPLLWPFCPSFLLFLLCSSLLVYGLISLLWHRLSPPMAWSMMLSPFPPYPPYYVIVAPTYFYWRWGCAGLCAPERVLAFSLYAQVGLLSHPGTLACCIQHMLCCKFAWTYNIHNSSRLLAFFLISFRLCLPGRWLRSRALGTIPWHLYRRTNSVHNINTKRGTEPKARKPRANQQESVESKTSGPLVCLALTQLV